MGGEVTGGARGRRNTKVRNDTKPQRGNLSLPDVTALGSRSGSVCAAAALGSRWVWER